jgi:hypothetical protein
MQSWFSHACSTVPRTGEISGCVGSVYILGSTVFLPVTLPAYYLFCCQGIHRDGQSVGFVYISLFLPKKGGQGFIDVKANESGHLCHSKGGCGLLVRFLHIFQ